MQLKYTTTTKNSFLRGENNLLNIPICLEILVYVRGQHCLGLTYCHMCATGAMLCLQTLHFALVILILNNHLVATPVWLIFLHRPLICYGLFSIKKIRTSKYNMVEVIFPGQYTNHKCASERKYFLNISV